MTQRSSKTVNYVKSYSQMKFSQRWWLSSRERLEILTRTLLQKCCSSYCASSDAKIIKNSVERLLAMAERFYISGAKGFSSLHWRAHMSIAIAAKVYRQIGVQLANRGYIWHEGRQVTTRTTKFICSFRAISGLAKRFSRRKHEHNSNLHTSLRGLPYVSWHWDYRWRMCSTLTSG